MSERKITTEADYLAKVFADFAVLKSIAAPILADEYGIHDQLHVSDICSEVASLAPYIAAEVAMSVETGPEGAAAATEVIREMLAAFHTFDCFAFAVIDSSPEGRAYHQFLLQKSGRPKDQAHAEAQRYSDDVRRRSCYQLAHQVAGTPEREPREGPLHPGMIGGLGQHSRFHVRLLARFGVGRKPEQAPEGEAERRAIVIG